MHTGTGDAVIKLKGVKWFDKFDSSTLFQKLEKMSHFDETIIILHWWASLALLVKKCNDATFFERISNTVPHVTCASTISFPTSRLSSWFDFEYDANHLTEQQTAPEGTYKSNLWIFHTIVMSLYAWGMVSHLMEHPLILKKITYTMRPPNYIDIRNSTWK